jgi:hypothetical protein
MKLGELVFVDVGGYGFVAAEGFARKGFELLEAGEFVEIAQAETHKKFFGSFVQDRAANDFLAPGGGDEFFVEKGGDYAGGVNAADFGNFGGGDGLLVGDDRESFESRHGETERRAEGLDEAANDVVMLWLGVHLVATGDGADLDAAIFGGIGGDELVESGFNGKFIFVEGSGELVESGGLVGGVDDGFESGLEVGSVRHVSSQFTVNGSWCKAVRKRKSDISDPIQGTRCAKKLGVRRRGRTALEPKSPP